MRDSGHVRIGSCRAPAVDSVLSMSVTDHTRTVASIGESASHSPTRVGTWRPRRTRPIVTWGRNGRSVRSNPAAETASSTAAWASPRAGPGWTPTQSTRGFRGFGKHPPPRSRRSNAAHLAASTRRLDSSRSIASLGIDPRNRSVRCSCGSGTQRRARPPSLIGAVARTRPAFTSSGKVIATKTLADPLTTHRSRGGRSRRVSSR